MVSKLRFSMVLLTALLAALTVSGCSRHAATPSASHWQDQAPIIPGSKTRYVSDGEPVDELPANFYSSLWYTDKLISSIVSGSEDKVPFFAFLSFAAPHNPLHVPRKYIDKYKGLFDQGWDQLAVQRLALGGEGVNFFESFDNSLENRGSPGSSTDIGAGWAYAAATPLRLFKGYVAQGGIQVPAVIKLPGNIINAGSRSNHLTHVMDLMPTFLSVAGAGYPEEYNGETIVPLQGRSLLPLLSGQSSDEYESRQIGWSAYGMDAYRQGHWKALRLPEPYGNGAWQLYDLEADPGELHNLASVSPDRVEILARGWQNYADSNGVIQPDSATFYSRPVVGRKY